MSNKELNVSQCYAMSWFNSSDKRRLDASVALEEMDISTNG